jgi:hypothetical protein
MLVLTSRYGEETALRALRYFASFAFNVSLFLERIPCAKLAKYRKARGVGWFLRRAAPTCDSFALFKRDDAYLRMNKEHWRHKFVTTYESKR